jgi:hypothetical protein
MMVHALLGVDVTVAAVEFVVSNSISRAIAMLLQRCKAVQCSHYIAVEQLAVQSARQHKQHTTNSMHLNTLYFTSGTEVTL